MDYAIFNVRADINACDSTQWRGGGRRERRGGCGSTDTVKEYALKVNSWRKIPCRTGDSNLRRQRAGPILRYQLSYIPNLPFPTLRNFSHASVYAAVHSRQLYLPRVFSGAVIDNDVGVSRYSGPASASLDTCGGPPAVGSRGRRN